jgi:stage V sporulation protein D (sporulation-specific penicillin-binding protein)
MSANKPSRKNPIGRFTTRVRVLAGFFVLVVLLCIGRLYYIQVMKGDEYKQRADREFLAPQNPLFNRGTIYFTTKDGAHIAAAATQTGVSLAVEPPKIGNISQAYHILSSLIDLPRSDFFAKAQKPGAQWVVVADHLSTSTGAAIQKTKLPGVVVAQDSWRFYPGISLGAQTIGFVGYDSSGTHVVGRYGLERQYESVLERPSEDLYSNFFVQLFAGVQEAINGEGEEGDVITTIEPTVQQELERELQIYAGEWHPAVVGGIIMDPQTGAIYAMAANPTFDPNNFSQVSDANLFTNPMVNNVYEMGSIIKPLTMAAGLDAGVITATSTYNDTGCITVDTAKICNYDLKARGVIPMQQVLSQSLNVGASYVADRLGPAEMRDYFVNKYKMGEITGIDLPSEQSGLISNLTGKSTRHVEYDTASFGQGMALSPIKTVQDLAVLANGGKLVVPHVGASIITTAGLTQPISYPAPTQVLKPKSSEEVSQMLTTVVDTVLANGAVKFDHWSVAAKTGTAQVVDPTTGKYYPNLYLHSYFGYFPSYNSRFIIFLFALKPQGAPYASETWSTIFHDLVSFLINYYNVPPDR